MILRLTLLGGLAASGTRAECVPPAMATDPLIAPQSAVQAYVTALDAYAVCTRGEAATLPPLQRVAALKTYAVMFTAMQQAVDAYNAGLPQPRSGP